MPLTLLCSLRRFFHHLFRFLVNCLSRCSFHRTDFVLVRFASAHTVYSDQVTIMSGTSTSCVNGTSSGGAASSGASSMSSMAMSSASSMASGASSVSLPFQGGSKEMIWLRWIADGLVRRLVNSIFLPPSYFSLSRPLLDCLLLVSPILCISCSPPRAPRPRSPRPLPPSSLPPRPVLHPPPRAPPRPLRLLARVSPSSVPVRWLVFCSPLLVPSWRRFRSQVRYQVRGTWPKTKRTEGWALQSKASVLSPVLNPFSTRHPTRISPSVLFFRFNLLDNTHSLFLSFLKNARRHAH